MAGNAPRLVQRGILRFFEESCPYVAQLRRDGVLLVTRMMTIFAAFWLFAGTAQAAEAIAAPVQPDAATISDQSTIEAFYDGLVDTMKQGPKLGFSGRAEKIEPLVKSTFSLDFMAQLIVGPTWRSIEDGQKNQVVSAFSDWVVANYASQFTSYDGEKFETGGVKDGGRGTKVVETKIVPNGGDPVALGYRMLNGKVIDVYLDGSVSQLALWRSQFASVIKKDGIDGLVARLKEQAQKMAS